MPDGPRDVASIQTELNRQSLVEIGKRLTLLEHKLEALEGDAHDLRFFTNNSLETVKRIQARVKLLVEKCNQEKQEVTPH